MTATKNKENTRYVDEENSLKDNETRTSDLEPNYQQRNLERLVVPDIPFGAVKKGKRSDKD